MRQAGFVSGSTLRELVRHGRDSRFMIIIYASYNLMADIKS